MPAMTFKVYSIWKVVFFGLFLFSWPPMNDSLAYSGGISKLDIFFAWRFFKINIKKNKKKKVSNLKERIKMGKVINRQCFVTSLNYDFFFVWAEIQNYSTYPCIIYKCGLNP